jgi:solute carrier family 29 (equilibrative nucleoside transporter), member 1/2/3
MLSAIILIVIPFLAHIGGAYAFWSVFVVLFIYGIILGIQQASIYSMAGVLPFRFMGAVMVGNGVAGIASNILRALSLIIWPVKVPGNEFKGALVFFLIAAVFMIICGMC